MRQLYSYPLCSFSRLVRIYLKEKSLDFELLNDLPWARKRIFSEKHMLSDIPTLIDNDGTVLEGWYAIVEHLEQVYRSVSFFGGSHREKAETRRIMTIFNEMFFADVIQNIVFEKAIKKYIENSSPDSSRIRVGNANIKKYFNYISWLTERRNWLAGDNFSLADISAAAQISSIDYMGSVDWDAYPEVKMWYVRIKSRPSFRDILHDRVSNILPAEHYHLLDF